ncbi:ParB/RepB/Spo0J family partition protein [Trueperella sp. LYQ141]|uniref:ParB/RepB/Spo0J family partition protein n=1 Tax=Trueperella sp. LYQ141 TaxID=3391058 RepID=UPI00398368C5
MAGKRSVLGRGLGSLFPEEQTEHKHRAIDVFFSSHDEKERDSQRVEALTADESHTADNESYPSFPNSTQGITENTESSLHPEQEPAETETARATQKNLRNSRKSRKTPIENPQSRQSDQEKAGKKDTASEKSTPSRSRSSRKGGEASSHSSAHTTSLSVKTLNEKREAKNENKTHISVNSSVSSADQHSIAKPKGRSGSATDTNADTNNAQRMQTDTPQLVPVPGASFGYLDVREIVPNQRQPRETFDESELAELAESIQQVGVLQPVVVRPLAAPLAEHPEARYELVMGERRWRATQRAGETEIPAIIRHTQDEDLLRDALLENLHRSNLNALEEAAAYQQLLEDFGCTQEELSRRIARSRPQISNTLRLLKLPPLVQRRVAAGVLSSGHARALLSLKDPAAMERVAQRIVAESLSVRQVEEIVALGEDGAEERVRRVRRGRYQAELNELAMRLTDRFDTRVKINMGATKGKIAIEFASIEDLNRILDTINEQHVDLME